MSHTRRAANGAAHMLAKMGLQLSEAHSWNSDFPECMNDIVRTEESF
jgi:hypothetical protein